MLRKKIKKVTVSTTKRFFTHKPTRCQNPGVTPRINISVFVNSSHLPEHQPSDSDTWTTPIRHLQHLFRPQQYFVAPKYHKLATDGSHSEKVLPLLPISTGAKQPQYVLSTQKTRRSYLGGKNKSKILH